MQLRSTTTNPYFPHHPKNLHLPDTNCPRRHGVVHCCLIVAAATAYGTGDQLAAGVLAVIGVIALGLWDLCSTNQGGTRFEMKIDVPKVMTTIECTNKGCNNKTVREFQRGDYVYKELDAACTKCGGKQMITAIYKEVKEKEKTFTYNFIFFY